MFSAAIWSPVGCALGRDSRSRWQSPRSGRRLGIDVVATSRLAGLRAHRGDSLGQGIPHDLLGGQHALATPAPPGRLPVAVESGVRTVRDCAWQQLLQVEACTWCGKCQEVCPGPAPGIRALAAERRAGHGLAAPRDAVQGQRRDAQAARHAVKPEELWGCYTCRACEEICPVLRPAAASDRRPPPAPGDRARWTKGGRTP